MVRYIDTDHFQFQIHVMKSASKALMNEYAKRVCKALLNEYVLVGGNACKAPECASVGVFKAL